MVMDGGVGGARECKLSGRCRDIELEISLLQTLFCLSLNWPETPCCETKCSVKETGGA